MQVGVRDAGLIPGWGKSPGGRHGNPLKYSFLENPTGRGAWWATVHRVTKSQAWLQWLSTCACIDKWIPYQISFFWANQVIFSYYLIYNIKVLSSSYSLVMRMTKLWWSWQWDFLYELSDALFKNYSVWDPKNHEVFSLVTPFVRMLCWILTPTTFALLSLIIFRSESKPSCRSNPPVMWSYSTISLSFTSNMAVILHLFLIP